jgi:hypothetical protein
MNRFLGGAKSAKLQAVDHLLFYHIRDEKEKGDMIKGKKEI